MFNSSSWLLTWSFNNECSNSSSSCSTTTRRNEMRQKMLHAYDDVYVVRLQIAHTLLWMRYFQSKSYDLIKAPFRWKKIVFGSNHFILHFIFVAVIRYDFLGISISFHGESIHVFQPISIVYIWFRLIWIRIWRHYLIKLRKSKRKKCNLNEMCAISFTKLAQKNVNNFVWISIWYVWKKNPSSFSTLAPSCF